MGGGGSVYSVDFKDFWHKTVARFWPKIAVNDTVRRLHAGIHARSCRDINKKKRGGETHTHGRRHV